MKNYKNAVPLLLVLLMFLGIYTSVTSAKTQQLEYETYLKEARESGKQGIIEDAKKDYDAVLEIKYDITIAVEKGEMLQENGLQDEAIEWAQSLVESHPKQAKAYAFLMKLYLSEQAYGECFALYEQAESADAVNSDIMQQIEGIWNEYTFASYAYDDVGVFGNGYCAVETDGIWGYVDEQGQAVISGQYEEAGSFVDNYAAVCDQSGEWYYIDQNGNKKFVVQNLEQCEGLSAYCGGILSAWTQGSCAYYDIDFNKLSEDYKNATLINQMGAVEEADGWYLIGKDLIKISEKAYEKVAVDEKGIACRNERLFAYRDSTYHMVDLTGKELSESYEDAYVFLEEDGFAAVEKNGKWGFVDKDGNIVIQPEYEDAHSFLNGMAAVKQNGLWGFIDADNQIIVKPQYEDAKNMNASGCAYVEDTGLWKLLMLYRFNH